MRERVTVTFELKRERRQCALETMGITGLLPALKSVTHQVHIGKYAGKTAGIDAAGWLYRGAYSCPVDVVLRTKDADGCEHCAATSGVDSDCAVLLCSHASVGVFCDDIGT